MSARTPAPSGDSSFPLSPEPPTFAAPAPSVGVGGEFGAGLSMAAALHAPALQHLQTLLSDTQRRLGDALDRLGSERDDARKAVSDLETAHRRELDAEREKTSAERERANKAERTLEVESLRAEMRAGQETSALERMAEPLLGSIPALAAALGAQNGPAPSPVAAPVYAAPPAPATATLHTPAPPPADPRVMRDNLLHQFETGVLGSLVEAVRDASSGGSGASGVEAVHTGLAALGRVGITPDGAALGRIALKTAINGLREGHAAQAVAQALAPVMAVTTGVSSLLASISPALAVGMIASMAGIQIPEEAKPFVQEVIGYLAAGTDDATAGDVVGTDTAPEVVTP